jgi:hypothetical protein
MYLSFSLFSICTFLSPPLYLNLPLPAPLFVPSFLPFFYSNLPFSFSAIPTFFYSFSVSTFPFLPLYLYLPFLGHLHLPFSAFVPPFLRFCVCTFVSQLLCTFLSPLLYLFISLYARHFLPRRRSRKCSYIPFVHWYLPTKLHDVICRKTIILKFSYISKKQWDILRTTNVPFCATGMPSRVMRLGRRRRTVARYPALNDAGHPAKVSACRWWHMLRNSKKLTSSTAFLHANQAVMKIVS